MSCNFRFIGDAMILFVLLCPRSALGQKQFQNATVLSKRTPQAETPSSGVPAIIPPANPENRTTRKLNWSVRRPITVRVADTATNFCDRKCESARLQGQEIINFESFTMNDDGTINNGEQQVTPLIPISDTRVMKAIAGFAPVLSPTLNELQVTKIYSGAELNGATPGALVFVDDPKRNLSWVLQIIFPNRRQAVIRVLGPKGGSPRIQAPTPFEAQQVPR